MVTYISVAISVAILYKMSWTSVTTLRHRDYLCDII